MEKDGTINSIDVCKHTMLFDYSYTGGIRSQCRLTTNLNVKKKKTK